MEEQMLSPLRSRSSRKPWPDCPDIAIYRCDHCGRLFQGLNYDELTSNAPYCCNHPSELLKPLTVAEIPKDTGIDYKIVGGFNQNAVQVFWRKCEPRDKPEWILLKTFTGSYIKYVTEKKDPPLIFPLSDEDAYAYCDRKVCTAF